MLPLGRLKELLEDKELTQIKGLRPGLYRARCWEITAETLKDDPSKQEMYDFASKEGVIKVSLEDQFIASGFFFARAAGRHTVVYPTPISDDVKTRIADCEAAVVERQPPALDGDVVWVLFDGGDITAQALPYWLPITLEGTSFVSLGTEKGTGEIKSDTNPAEVEKHRFEKDAYKIVFGSNIFKLGKNELLESAPAADKHLTPAAKSFPDELEAQIKGLYLGIHDLTIESLNHARLQIRNSLDISTGVVDTPETLKLVSIKAQVEQLWLQADKVLFGAEGEMEQVVKGETTEKYLKDNLLVYINALKDIVQAIYDGYKMHTHLSAMGPTDAPMDILPAVGADLAAWSTEDPDILWDAAEDPGELPLDTV